jgi:hypothetical protein
MRKSTVVSWEKVAKGNPNHPTQRYPPPSDTKSWNEKPPASQRRGQRPTHESHPAQHKTHIEAPEKPGTFNKRCSCWLDPVQSEKNAICSQQYSL